MYSYLSVSQRLAVDKILAGNNVFITGAAGTGKSYLLNHLKTLGSRNIQLTATTGVAAINVGGTTLHSWAGLGREEIPVREIARRILSARGINIRRKILNTEALAIDEISMLSRETFEMLEELLRLVRGNSEPFGGIQMILFGDFFQLPPVKSSSYCFESPVWTDASIETVVLEEVFRQQDRRFVELLDNLRWGLVVRDDLDLLEGRSNLKPSGVIEPTVLSTHNLSVEKINLGRLNFLPSREVTYRAKYSGSADKIESFRRNSLAKEVLTLKVGSQVMMLRNVCPKEGIINGSVGVVTGFSAKKSYPLVDFGNAREFLVVPETWEISSFSYETGELEVIATMTQIPLALAWAMTVHKSQGMTIDRIECDLRNSFAEGQVYVALSRARSLEGIFIRSLDPRKLMVNRKIVEFYRAATTGKGRAQAVSSGGIWCE
ncbi:MAG: AAA family ATPase [Rickettsiales bacterium]|nr:AAA family ATPase [Rickettsiales bacterium]